MLLKTREIAICLTFSRLPIQFSRSFFACTSANVFANIFSLILFRRIVLFDAPFATLTETYVFVDIETSSVLLSLRLWQKFFSPFWKAISFFEKYILLLLEKNSQSPQTDYFNEILCAKSCIFCFWNLL